MTSWAVRSAGRTAVVPACGGVGLGRARGVHPAGAGPDHCRASRLIERRRLVGRRRRQQLVVECHRRALVVATDAAEAGSPVDENLIARLQDLIVESQQTYTVTVADGNKREVELPRRQYKPVSNYLLRSNYELVPSLLLGGWRKR